MLKAAPGCPVTLSLWLPGIPRGVATSTGIFRGGLLKAAPGYTEPRLLRHNMQETPAWYACVWP